MVTKEWVAIHRKHHQNSDKEGDPHSPHVEGIWAILFSGAYYYHLASKDKDMINKYGVGTPNDWIEQNVYSKYSILGVSLLLIIDCLLFGWWGLWVWSVQMFWIPFWAAGVINGLGHYYGYRNYDSKDKSYFKGEISNFAIFEEILSNQEIRELSKNQFFGLTSNFGNYKSSHLLKTYYDAKFIKDSKIIDLSGNNNDGIFENCKLSGYISDYKKVIYIPFRKDCTFELLSHEENGYVGNAWKNITTRYNQMRFHNEVKNDLTNPLQDGLSNCKYREHSNTKVLNETNITVGI